jgi:hypothetical protein
MRQIEGGSMKLLLALLGVLMGIAISVPAHADPGIDESPTNENNETFLADLHKVGIAYGDPSQAISAGQAVCAHIHNGMSGLHLIKHLQENNPALTENGAAQFATISAKSYCPRQLDETEEPGGHKGGGGKGGD